MAEKKGGYTYEKIMTELKNKQYAPVYVLMGEEPYFIDCIANYIETNVLTPEEQDFNQTVIYGSDTNGAKVADLAKGYPMMAQYRVVVVKEAQAMNGAEALANYLNNPSPSTILVICYKHGTVDKRKKWIALADKIGIVFESKKKREWELAGFVSTYVQTQKATIEPKAADMLAEFVGANLHRLIAEVDKILLSLSENDKRITPDIVEEQVGILKDFNTFELLNAIVEKDVLKANRIVHYFDKNRDKSSLYISVPMLFNFFQNLMIAYYAPNRSSAESVAQFLKLSSPWAAKNYITAMRNFSGVKTMNIVHKIRETDAKLKGLDNVSTPPFELLQELIFFILH